MIIPSISPVDPFSKGSFSTWPVFLGQVNFLVDYVPAMFVVVYCLLTLIFFMNGDVAQFLLRYRSWVLAATGHAEANLAVAATASGC